MVTFRFPGLPPEARRFLRDLRENNRREWFQPRKALFEKHVRQPLLQLVDEAGRALAEHSPGFLLDPPKSVYRIYRDIRFSKDKSPYKTHVAAIFPPVGIPRHGGAGFYFHFSADELLIGGGLYRPASPDLARIRSQIAADPDELRAILGAPAFQAAFSGLDGERLKRAPRGFPRDHVATDLLVYKQFLAGATMPASEVERPSIGPLLDSHFRALGPLVAYLNRPLLSG